MIFVRTALFCNHFVTFRQGYSDMMPVRGTIHEFWQKETGPCKTISVLSLPHQFTENMYNSQEIVVLTENYLSKIHLRKLSFSQSQIQNVKLSFTLSQKHDVRDSLTYLWNIRILSQPCPKRGHSFIAVQRQYYP